MFGDPNPNPNPNSPQPTKRIRIRIRSSPAQLNESESESESESKPTHGRFFSTRSRMNQERRLERGRGVPTAAVRLACGAIPARGRVAAFFASQAGRPKLAPGFKWQMKRPRCSGSFSSSFSRSREDRYKKLWQFRPTYITTVYCGHLPSLFCFYSHHPPTPHPSRCPGCCPWG